MARRELRFTIAEKNRDHGKIFFIREMPADQTEWWAARILFALTNAGADLPKGAAEGGMAGFAAAGIQSLLSLRAEVVKPLMDEMFTCVEYLHEGKLPAQPILSGDLSQIEEVSTRVQLRKAVLELHVGFSLGEFGSTTESPSPSPAPALRAV